MGIVGTCALRKTGERQFELTKRGVLDSARGKKAGEFLLKAIIARAYELGCDRLYLLSNSDSQAAIHLYEKLGFDHDAQIMNGFGKWYERCNVAMLHTVRASGTLKAHNAFRADRPSVRDRLRNDLEAERVESGL